MHRILCNENTELTILLALGNRQPMPNWTTIIYCLYVGIFSIQENVKHVAGILSF